jgi:hypothetical protein
VKISLLQGIVKVGIFLLPSFLGIKFVLWFRDGENRNVNL